MNRPGCREPLPHRPVKKSGRACPTPTIAVVSACRGRACSALLALALMAALPVAAVDKPKLSFVKDIVPIFTKSGCANSNCHGSIRGQAGFKLSLFGYEPDLDFDAIVKAQDGRRINRTDPARSLILLKPTFSVPHGGGVRFKVASLEYEAILDWLKDGAT